MKSVIIKVYMYVENDVDVEQLPGAVDGGLDILAQGDAEELSGVVEYGSELEYVESED